MIPTIFFLFNWQTSTAGPSAQTLIFDAIPTAEQVFAPTLLLGGVVVGGGAGQQSYMIRGVGHLKKR